MFLGTSLKSRGSVGTIIISILQISKLGLRGVNWLRVGQLVKRHDVDSARGWPVSSAKRHTAHLGRWLV